MNPQTVTITRMRGDLYSVRFQYDEAINSILRAHRGWWDRDLRCWQITGTANAESVRSALTIAGYSVLMPGGQSGQSGSTGRPPTGNSPHIDVLAELLADFGLPAYRALTKITHPDVGGSTEWSQRINVAWERAQRKAG